MISHINSNESNNWNTSNSDNLIGNSNLPHSSVKNESSFNTLVNLQKATDSDSSASINDETLIKFIEVKKFHLIKIHQK